MLYEIKTFDLKPRTLRIVEQHLAETHKMLGEPPELIGSFHTEIGPLNQVVQFRRYDDLQHCQRCWDDDSDHAPIATHLVSTSRDLMSPTSLSRELAPGQLGPYFELRTYMFPVGELEKLLSAWRRAMPMREALGSPVAAIWTPLTGRRNSLIHLWPYPSLEERERIRKEVRLSGLWPPYLLDEAEGGAGYEIVSQSNKLMIPATFSPLQ
jgi:NIPSNAP